MGGTHRDADRRSVERDFGQRGHFARAVAEISASTLAELSIVVVSPTLHGSVIEQRTRKPISRSDLQGATTGAEVDDGQTRAHFTGFITTIRGVVSSQCTLRVVPPAFHVAVVEQSTCVGVADGNLNNVRTCPQVYCLQSRAHLSGTITAIRGVAETELAGGITSPTLEIPLDGDRARVRDSSLNIACTIRIQLYLVQIG